MLIKFFVAHFFKFPPIIRRFSFKRKIKVVITPNPTRTHNRSSPGSESSERPVKQNNIAIATFLLPVWLLRNVGKTKHARIRPHA